MEQLITYSNNLIQHTNDNFFRYLYSQINWDQRMIAIKGPRGVGKTTLMLQRIKYNLKHPKEALYVSVDHPWFFNNGLLELAEEFSKYGGKWLFIDEVHKYPHWSREIKTIYDGNPELKIVFSASSALDIYRGEADLSRRVITYDLSGMSLREYIEMKYQIVLPILTLENILEDHELLSKDILKKIKPLVPFKEFLERGYYPYSFESNKEEYYIKIYQTINTIIESDLAAVEGYSPASAIKLKKLLGVIAESVPFHPNISSLANKLNISRDSVYLYLHYLQKAKILNFISQEGKGVSTLQKPDKIYLENTNLNFSLRLNPEKGNLRETFLHNQLLNAGNNVTMPSHGDFKVNEKYTLEVGGKTKSGKQIHMVKNAYIVTDDLEIGMNNKIPLWLFGFLY